MSGLLGKKVGMTSIYDAAGNFVPVTVIEVEPKQTVTMRFNLALLKSVKSQQLAQKKVTLKRPILLLS